MKNSITILLLFFCGILCAQELEGAWLLVEENGEAITSQESVKIYQDGYFAFGTKEKGTNKFIEAGGGEFTINGSYIETYDFHSSNPDLVGTDLNYTTELKNDTLILISKKGKQIWTKLAQGKNELSGNWVITGRMRDGEITTMTPGARRTIKILGGGRFQWAAFNSETKEFHGTGGGTYSAENGVYIENIEFFSRDDSRVGAMLPFQYELKNGKWHHRGKSSKGAPMYEIWSLYEMAYTPVTQKK